MQSVSNSKLNLSQPLPPRLVCNQGNHSVVKQPITFSISHDTYTNVLESLITVGIQSRQWVSTVLNDAEEVGN